MNLKDAGIYDLTNIFKGEATKAHSASGASQEGIISNTPRTINIPAYQRPYRWTSEYIERLFQDYDENRSEYFLGSAVVVENKNGETIDFDIVDGQQRITTLFLINFVRFLLKREFVFDKIQRRASITKYTEYCSKIKKCYVNLIGKDVSPFDELSKVIETNSEDDELDSSKFQENLEQILVCYKNKLCIPELKETAAETMNERKAKAERFFGGDRQLCLKYSRMQYDRVLKKALCSVYIERSADSNNCELKEIGDVSSSGDFTANYIKAIFTIFNKLWEHALDDLGEGEERSWSKKCEKVIDIKLKMI